MCTSGTVQFQSIRQSRVTEGSKNKVWPQIFWKSGQGDELIEIVQYNDR